MLDLARLRGIFPPILTPVTDDEDVDHESLGSLVRYLLDHANFSVRSRSQHSA